MNHRNRLTISDRRRTGYTLVEIMIVITIILIIVAMTVSAVNFNREADRVRSGARRVQSFLSGARDRAIYSKEPRGVRLFVESVDTEDVNKNGILDAGEDTNGNGSIDVIPSAKGRTVSTMAYIAPGGTWASPANSASIDLLRRDGNSDGDFKDAGDVVSIVRGKNNPGWWNLKRRGWLVDGLRIRIPAGPTGTWYAIDTRLIDTTKAPTDIQLLLLQIPYSDGGDAGQEVAFQDLTYEIELPYRILPQDPAVLPEGVVIDLDASKLPDLWRPVNSGNGQYSGFMDIVFSPRGNVIGDAAAAGVMHFYVCDSEDSLILKEQFVAAVGLGNFDNGVPTVPFIPVEEINRDAIAGGWLNNIVEAGEKYLVKERRIISLFTQTGAASVHKVANFSGTTGAQIDNSDPYDVDGDSDFTEPDGLLDSPYYYAETGEVSP